MSNDKVIRENTILQRFDLCGRIAVITGGGGELCGAMAEALALAGVRVAILDIGLEKARNRASSVIAAGGEAPRAYQLTM